MEVEWCVGVLAGEGLEKVDFFPAFVGLVQVKTLGTCVVVLSIDLPAEDIDITIAEGAHRMALSIVIKAW